MDIVVESLSGTYSDFTILWDLPEAFQIKFQSDGRVTSWPTYLLDEEYRFGVPMHIEMEVDFSSDWWKVWIDRDLKFVYDYEGYYCESVRVNLRGESASDSAAMDNFLVTGEDHVCCLGQECVLTRSDDCHDLGGQYHLEWDSCGPVNPCGGPTPNDNTSWGQIKTTFR